MNPQDLMYTQRRFSLLNLISFVVFVVFLLYVGYLFVGKAGLAKDVAEAEASITDLEVQVAALEEQSLDEVTIAQAVLDSIADSEIAWSGVIADLLESTPLDVYYSSYSGSETGVVTVNAMGDSYESVAGLIEALQGESNFQDVFVPSISETDDMANFGFSFTYEETTSVARE